MIHRLTHRGRPQPVLVNLARWTLAALLACGTPLAQAQTAPPSAATEQSAPPSAAPSFAAPPSAAPLDTTAPQPAIAAPDVTTSPSAHAATPVPSIEATLPRDLSPLGMFMQADIIVKAVMIGLALASVVTWSVWLAKTIELFAARRRARRDIACLAQAGALAEAGTALANVDSDVASLCRAAIDELRRSHDAMNPDGVKERVASHFSRIEAAAARRMTRGTGVLATIGSTAPFVGLFGTVWGIMNAFIGISKAQTTNLAVVAPGIAEALLATALGLVAAIPAVIIFNMFARATAGYRGLLGDGAAELLRMVSRDLDRAEGFRRRAAAE
jgi:biopolymer transport protein ExbB